MKQWICTVGVCQLRAQLLPVLTVRALPPRQHVNARMILSLPTCVYCSRRLRHEQFLGEAGWQSIEQGFKAKDAEVDRSTAALEFITIDGPEARELFQASAIKRQVKLN